MNNKGLILLVDDEPIARDVLRGFLVSEGYDFQHAESGAKALAYLEQVVPDLILLDVMMPDMDGFEVCRRVKSDKRWWHIPVIIVTALGSKRDLVRGFEAGADDFLSKPVDEVELRARVRSMLRIKRQYDELQETLQLREDMANMIVHDMRTPLTAIVGYSQLLQAKVDLSPPFSKFVQSIVDQSRRLDSFLNDMLLMAKMEAGQPILHKTFVDVNELVEKIQNSHQVSAASKGINLVLDLPLRPQKIPLDRNLFQRVLDNLVSNALKFSSTGGRVLVQVRYPKTDQQSTQPQLRIRVIDEGPGIPAEDRERIFYKFEVVAMERKKGTQVGLGLAFCKIIVEAHGGVIYVEPNQPVGSIFTVEI